MKIPKPTKATGSHFYKYASPDHLERLKVTILKHELYLPNLTQLNDPTDGRPKLSPMTDEEMIDYLYRDFIRRNPHLTTAALKMNEKIIRYNVPFHGRGVHLRNMSEILNAELEGFRIYSLSKRWDNIVLWGTYAASHRGYCLEFANEGPLFRHAKEVSYGNFEVSITDSELRSGAFFFCKTPDWRSEEEVRLVLGRGQGSKVTIDPHWLTRLILGKDMAEDHRNRIRGWAKERKPELVVVDAYFDQLHQVLILKP
jgi:hypothetical protein